MTSACFRQVGHSAQGQQAGTAHRAHAHAADRGLSFHGPRPHHVQPAAGGFNRQSAVNSFLFLCAAKGCCGYYGYANPLPACCRPPMGRSPQTSWRQLSRSGLCQMALAAFRQATAHPVLVSVPKSRFSRPVSSTLTLSSVRLAGCFAGWHHRPDCFPP
jgi:hypothetical protein